MRSVAILGCNIYSQITLAQVTLLKAVLNTDKVLTLFHICSLWPDGSPPLQGYHLSFPLFLSNQLKLNS